MATVRYPKKRMPKTANSQDKASGGGMGTSCRKGKESIGGSKQGRPEAFVVRDGGSDNESHVEGYETGQCNMRITYERKPRSCCQGDYGKKPPPDAKPKIHMTDDGKGIVEPKPMKTLGYIVREKWDEYTLDLKGGARDAFYYKCIKEFREYYDYPHEGDLAVLEHLRRNFKSYLNAEKKRLVERMQPLVDAGYSKKEVQDRWFDSRPHYFGPSTWHSICKNWASEDFETKSEIGRKNRACVELNTRTGAKSFTRRREEIDAAREAKGEPPITDEEFLSYVYDPTDPVVKSLREKMQKVRSALPEASEAGLELTMDDEQPSSLATKKSSIQRAVHRKRNVLVTIQAREPKKGKIPLHPRQTVAELLGAREAAQLIGSQKVQTNTAAVPVPDEIYLVMSKILNEVRQMVSSMPMREVKQSILDEEVQKLAFAAYPDPSQHLLCTNYVRAANGLLNQILKDHDKVIKEEIVPVPEPNGNAEDVDQDAHLFPLA